MQLVTIGNLVVKLVEGEKTLIRTHSMKSGLWAVACGTYYREFPEDVAKEVFKQKAMGLILGSIA